MYYRRGFYPRPGQADVPDDLWAEFQRIRGHLSKIDQNNVDNFSLSRDDIARPDTLDHAGISDIVGTEGDFLYKAISLTGSDELVVGAGLSVSGAEEGRWLDLGPRGLQLRGHSRGDAPWIVGASIDFYGEGGGDSLFGFGDGRHKGVSPVYDYVDGETLWSSVKRVNVRLRVKTKQGLSAAESVGGLDNFSTGGSLAVVSCALSGGGPVEFSPMVKIEEKVVGEDGVAWKCHIAKANIFAFGLYR